MIYVRDIINVCHGRLIHGDLDFLCDNFSTDTRKLNNGDIYFGIKGENFNGNDFYKEAFLNGASYCVLNEGTVVEDEDLNVIFVEDTIKALQELARYKRSLYDIPVIAITGSVGKTSTKDIIRAVVSTEYNVLATVGNLNNHLGVPLTILGLKDHNALIVEMGMNHSGELHVLSNIAKPTLGVITNVGTAHIGNLGSRENILKAKLEILDGMNGGSLIINNDNDLLHTVKYDNLITIGINNDSDYMARDVILMPFSSGFWIGDNYIEIPVPSEAFIYNALMGFAVGKKLGISEENIEKALRSFKLTPHRLEVIDTKRVKIIDDTYNASLDSVKNSLSLLNKVTGRKVFVFADILEVDGFGEEIHREVGKACIDNNIDVVITVGNLSKYTYDELDNSKVLAYHFNNNSELLKKIEKIIQDKDTILLKGSHAMRLDEIVDYLRGLE